MMRLDLREASRPYAPKVPHVPHLREAAIATWRGRMVNESISARVFETLADQLEAIDIAEDRIARVRSFADEERRHGHLCGAVVEALGGEAVAEFEEPPAVPLHEAVGPVEAAARNLISISCLHETVASALIGAERLDMPEGELRELLTRIYAEECGHANFGWRLLPEILERGDAGLSERLGAYLRVAFGFLEEHELDHLPLDVETPDGGEALGLCSGADSRALFYATVEQVIVPGLEAAGLPARASWETRVSAAR